MSDLTGTRHLVRLTLRRDRVRLPIWVLGLTAMTAASAGAVQGLYDEPQEVAGYQASVADSTAGRLINGTPHAVDNVGGITSYEVTSLAGLLVALMVTFLVVRHTRAEEESGTAELLRSTVAGRHAATAAALVVAAGASLAVGALDALVLVVTGLPVSGSLLHGAALAGVGLAFTALAAAAAQLTNAGRGALGMAGAAIAVFFVLRGVGAVQENGLVWASPFGWQQEVRDFGDQRWWPLLLTLVFTAVLSAVAAWLTAHRDFGSGLLAARAGSPRAASGLATPVGLAWRLQRGLFLGWAVGLTLFASLFGSLGREVVTLVESNPEMADVFGAALDDVVRGYFAYAVPFLGVLASAYAVASALRLRAEEAAGRAEAVLSTGLGRVPWAVGGITVTVLGTLAILLLVGLGLSGTHALVSGDRELFWPLLGAALVQAPAVLLLAAVGVLLHGWTPRWSVLAWAFFAFALLQAYLGELLSFPGWLSGVSPFWHLPLMPVEEFEPVPLLVLGVLAVLAVAAGLVGLRRRDLALE